jgi:ankyrin repeat protein
MYVIGMLNLKAVSALLEAGADVNAQDKDGKTALMYAAFHSSPKIIAALLKNGADVMLKDSAGRMALDIAAGKKNLQGTYALQRLRMAVRVAGE